MLHFLIKLNVSEDIFWFILYAVTAAALRKKTAVDGIRFQPKQQFCTILQAQW